MKKILLLSLCCLCSSLSITATSINFIENDLDLAKQKAAREGKLILVDFWAHWCNPCTWMDEHTFTNPQLSEYINDNYISVRVDIDNLQGFGYKEQFKIRYLPSILILNDQGQLIKKYEESFAPSKLLTILKEHNKGGHNTPYYASASTERYQPSNPVKRETQSAPSYNPALSSDFSSSETTTTNSTPSTSNYSSSSGATSTNPSSTTSTSTYSTPTSGTASTYHSSTISSGSTGSTSSTAPSTNNSVTTEHYYVASSTSDNSSTNPFPATNGSINQIDYSATGTYEFSVRPAPTSGYSVQVGAYYEYGNVLREVAIFQKQYMDVVYVHISRLNGAPCYKVLLGHFGTRDSANQQKAFLREKGLDCFVKELGAM